MNIFKLIDSIFLDDIIRNIIFYLLLYGFVNLLSINTTKYILRFFFDYNGYTVVHKRSNHTSRKSTVKLLQSADPPGMITTGNKLFDVI